MLTKEERRTLLAVARQRVAAAARGVPSSPQALPFARLREKAAAFVTLRRAGSIRGCIGHIEAVRPLWDSVVEMAEAAALRDDRFHPLQPEEVASLSIEISILSPMRPIRPDEVQVGVHGLYVRRGGQGGLLLPQVAVECGWDREEFIRRTYEKAGLPPDTPGAELLAFTAEHFGEQPQDRIT